MRCFTLGLLLVACYVSNATAQIPDPAFCNVNPCDALNGVILCPDTPNPIPTTLVDVVVRNFAGNPIPGAFVEMTFHHPAILLCQGAVLSGITNAAGQVQLRTAGGGCAAGVPNAAQIRANGVLIRSYSNVKSPDWDGVQADLVVDAADQAFFSNCFVGYCPCADYNNSGAMELADLALFQTPFSNNNQCAGTGGTPGACCIADVCQVLTPVDCTLMGGTFQGTTTACDPGTCTPAPTQCVDCGPGPHWIDLPLCPAGDDYMPSGALVGVDTNLDCVRDMNLVMGGPVRVRRSAPRDDSANYPGTRPVDGHFDVIDTEIIAMTLTGSGVTLVAGAGLGSIPLAPTRGNFAEQPGNPNLADSFFDVFFEVDLGGGNRLYNQTPLLLESVIDCVPPHAIYAHPTICIPLYTSPIAGQGVHVANLVTANHTPFPVPGACCEGDLCTVVTENECVAQGGTFQGENTGCVPNPCFTSQPCAECGPGPHWMDSPPCPAGDDTMPTGALAGIDITLDCVRDQNIVLTGPVRVRRTSPLDDSNNFPGTRPIDGHLDVIDTEIIEMTLTGSGVTLRAGAGVGVPPLPPSLGTIAEQPGNPDLADSFFDVFFEIELSGGTKLRNQTPLRIEAILDCIPPNAIYLHPNICIPLFDESLVHVANLVTANHSPFPQPGGCCFGATCVQLTANECEAQEGAFRGENTVCEPNPCVSTGDGACCLGLTCEMLESAQCESEGGHFIAAGVPCAPTPCHPVSDVDVDVPSAGGPTLLGSVPNPMHSQTTIRFYTTEPGDVSIEIFDANGRVVRQLQSRALGAGQQGVVWDGQDAARRPVPAGAYGYRVRVGDTLLSGKLTVIR